MYDFKVIGLYLAGGYRVRVGLGSGFYSPGESEIGLFVCRLSMNENKK